MDKEIKSAVKELKDSIRYRSEHMRLIEYFKDMIVQYFEKKSINKYSGKKNYA